MIKNIDIPDEILQDLKILAVKENKDLIKTTLEVAAEKAECEEGADLGFEIMSATVNKESGRMDLGIITFVF